MSNKLVWSLIATAALAVPAAATVAHSFRNPIEEPAARSLLGATSPMLAAAIAGDRIVGVGLRGQIIHSDDQGRRWTQAPSPVSSDLVELSFPSATRGWAVGHGGVVLHTADGGKRWTKQLDGIQAARLAQDFYKARGEAGDADAARKAESERSLALDGSTQPFLDVYFRDEKEGYVVGTFNRIYRTEDGGKTWQPWMDHTDNPGELHFYSIQGRDGALYLTGEQGVVWRYQADEQRFVAVRTPYQGTLFGVIVDGDVLIAHGMRGTVLRSADRGASWERIDIGSVAGVNAGAVLPDGRILLVTQAGTLHVSRDQGKTFIAQKSARPMSYYGVAARSGAEVVLVGADGVRQEAVQ